MKVCVRRFVNYSQCTVGLLFIDSVFFGYVLEDVGRLVKIKKETRIKAGKYILNLQKAGRLHQYYTTKYPFHKGMIHLNNVPEFQGVMFHIGNFHSDTEGCLLIGSSHNVNVQSVLASTAAYKSFYIVVAAALEKGERVELEITEIFE
jgi:hypothetical protein